MGIYTGPAPAGGWQVAAVCFSGTAAKVARIVLPIGLTVLGGVIGAGLGFLASFITGPEVISKVLGAFVGAVLGAVAGLIVSITEIRRGACPCPAGSEAFCICFPPPKGCPAACTLVPPGCP